MRQLRKLLTYILAIALTAVGAFAVTPTIARAVEPEIKFDSTDVLDDLSGMTIDGKPFDLDDYQYDGKGELKLLSMVEYCYSYKINMRDNYGLYIYLYNPQGLNFSTSSVSNQIELAVAYQDRVVDNAMTEVATAYEKFRLEYCSRTTDPNLLNLFYKFKVVDHVSAVDQKTIQDRVKPSERRYDVSGLELIQYGASTAKDYKVASTFRYQGYAKGYGPSEDADALSCTSNQLDVIELDLRGHDLVYRSDMDNPEKYDHNQINSVYFSVDARIIREYGNLQKIKAEWWEYRTQPIVIASDKSLYNSLKPWVGVTIGDFASDRDGVPHGVIHNGNVPYMLGDLISRQGSGGANNYFRGAVWDWSYNMPYDTSIDNMLLSQSPANKLKWLFSTGGKDLAHYVIGSAELEAYITDYTVQHGGASLPNKDGTVAAELFSEDVGVGRTAQKNTKTYDAGDLFDMLAYESHLSTWQDILYWLGMYDPQTSEMVTAIKPIEELTTEKLTANGAGQTLLMREEEIAQVQAYVTEQAQPTEDYPEGKRTYIFRHALTNYYGKQLHEYWKSGLVADVRKVGAAIVQENVFLDFDVIELTFRSGDQDTVFSVVSDPIDIFSPVEVPTLPHDPFNILQAIFALALLALVVFGAVKLIGWITTLIAGKR